MKKTLYKGIDPNDGKMAYFIIQGDKVAAFSEWAPMSPAQLKWDIDSWALYPPEKASKVIEAIPTFEELASLEEDGSK